MKPLKKVNVAIFASGNGTNAINIYHFFENHNNIIISKLFCNKAEAGVIDKFKNLEVETIIFSKREFSNESFSNFLKDVDFIVLSGFLLLVPEYLIKKFNGKVINIHPSLLPKFGGKLMYGHFVHEAVIEAKESHSGISIHLVNAEYDKGELLFQEKIKLSDNETAASLAKKIHQLEYTYYPMIIEKTIKKIFEC